MKEKIPEEILKNQVQFKNRVQKNIADCCDDPLVFAMEDNEHEFSLGLITVLQCLKIAENEGYVPKIDDNWWIAVSRYKQNHKDNIDLFTSKR